MSTSPPEDPADRSDQPEHRSPPPESPAAVPPAGRGGPPPAYSPAPPYGSAPAYGGAPQYTAPAYGPAHPQPAYPPPAYPPRAYPPPGYPPRPESFFWKPVLRTAGKTAAVLTVSFGMVLVLLLVLAGLAGLAGDADGRRPLSASYVAGDRGGERLLAIRVSGVILGEGESGLFGPAGTFGYTVKDQLRQAAEDESIHGVVLEMDTPGGTIFGARAIADGVEDYQKRTGRKVVAYVSSLSASGGMYAMAGADRIVADHGTLTGSIGVIFGPITFYDRPTAIDQGALVGGVETRNGITVEYVTAGRGKDAGNPFRRLTAEERGVIQRGVTRSYGEFVGWVSERRGIPREEIVRRIGAHVYDEQTARELGLVDEIGSRDDAYARAAQLAGVDRWRVDRVDQADGGLLGRLARRPAAEQAEKSWSLCTGQPAMLAYSGDLAALCRSGE